MLAEQGHDDCHAADDPGHDKRQGYGKGQAIEVREHAAFQTWMGTGAPPEAGDGAPVYADATLT